MEIERDFEFRMSSIEFLAWLSQQEGKLRASTIGVAELTGTGFVRSDGEWLIQQKIPEAAWFYPVPRHITLPGVSVTWTIPDGVLAVHVRCEVQRYAGVYAQLVVFLEKLERAKGGFATALARGRRPADLYRGGKSEASGRRAGRLGLKRDELAYRIAAALEAEALKKNAPSLTWKEIAKKIGWRLGTNASGVKLLEDARSRLKRLEKDDPDGILEEAERIWKEKKNTS